MELYTFRLKPGDDLYEGIEFFVRERQIDAGVILCAVGSLTHIVLRLANQEGYDHTEGHFEIVAITGTVSIHGSHIHIAISDGAGRTSGGHLVPGCKIFTTAEIVLAVFPGIVYRREPCGLSGYDELVVYPK